MSYILVQHSCSLIIRFFFSKKRQTEGRRTWRYVLHVKTTYTPVVWRHSKRFCFARWNKMYSSNENKTNALRRCWDVFFEGKSIRCSHGGLITVMLLGRLTKGQQSPRKSIFAGDKFASFSHKPLAKKLFSDEVKGLYTSFLLESTVLLCDGGKRRWICLQQEGPYRAWSFRCSLQRTSQKGDLSSFCQGQKKWYVFFCLT